jgi:hypothetical protein
VVGSHNFERAGLRAVQCPACGLPQKPGKTSANEGCAADIRAVKSSTAGLRFHDLRHHAITELAESQAGDQVIMSISIAGHVSGAMLRHYSHVRLCDQERLARSVGDRPTEVKVRSLVAWIAGRRGIESLKPIDKAIFRMVSK